jgi:hypothetical protein
MVILYSYNIFLKSSNSSEFVKNPVKIYQNQLNFGDNVNKYSLINRIFEIHNENSWSLIGYLLGMFGISK